MKKSQICDFFLKVYISSSIFSRSENIMLQKVAIMLCFDAKIIMLHNIVNVQCIEQ